MPEEWEVQAELSPHSKGDDSGLLMGRRRSGMAFKAPSRGGVEGLCPRVVSFRVFANICCVYVSETPS